MPDFYVEINRKKVINCDYCPSYIPNYLFQGTYVEGSSYFILEVHTHQLKDKYLVGRYFISTNPNVYVDSSIRLAIYNNNEKNEIYLEKKIFNIISELNTKDINDTIYFFKSMFLK